MNCQEFDQLVGELASSRLKDSTVRESGLAHSAICQICAARLANARTLQNGLKALASSTETSEATNQTEVILLAAFRRQQDQTAPSAQPKAAVVPARTNWLTRLPRLTYATAAVALIAGLGYGISVWKSANVAPQQIAATPSPKVQVPSHFPPMRTDDGLASLKQNEKQRIKQVTNRAQLKPMDDGSSVQATLGELVPISREEVATDFLPLIHEADSQPMDSGQVIRVQVPRTALTSFGLPINIERANELVKADLLLAEDGSARAIRFIR